MEGWEKHERQARAQGRALAASAKEAWVTASGFGADARQLNVGGYVAALVHLAGIFFNIG